MMLGLRATHIVLLTVLVSLFSLEQYAQFLVGGECDGLNRLLAAHFAPLVHDEPMCFEVHNTLGPGMWILLGGSFVSMALGHAVMVLGISALDDHERNLGRADRVRRQADRLERDATKLLRLAQCRGRRVPGNN